MSKSKLNNLLNFTDFSGGLPKNTQKKTKRTDVGLDILKESKDKIPSTKAMTSVRDKIKKTKEYGEILGRRKGTKELKNFLKKELKKYDHMLNDTEQQEVMKGLLHKYQP